MNDSPRSPYRSSLGRFADQMRDPDPVNGFRACAEIWERSDRDLLLIRLSTLESWTDRKQAELLGDRIYGKRRDEG